MKRHREIFPASKFFSNVAWTLSHCLLQVEQALLVFLSLGLNTCQCLQSNLMISFSQLVLLLPTNCLFFFYREEGKSETKFIFDIIYLFIFIANE